MPQPPSLEDSSTQPNSPSLQSGPGSEQASQMESSAEQPELADERSETPDPIVSRRVQIAQEAEPPSEQIDSGSEQHPADQLDDLPTEELEQDLWEGLLMEKSYKLATYTLPGAEVAAASRGVLGAARVRFSDQVEVEDVEKKEASPETDGVVQEIPDEGEAVSSSDPRLSRSGHTARGSDYVKVDNSAPKSDSNVYVFKRRQVEVNELVDGGNLGLLLTGTVVTAFACPEAELAGFHVGDHIVEVNSQPCKNFDEFLTVFLKAQCEGFPITFVVIRREEVGPDQSVIDLDDFCSNTVSLTSELSPRHDSMLENPYVKALRRRRNDLSRCNEGWSSATGGSAEENSLASRLATRGEAITILTPFDPPAPEPLSTKPGPCGSLVLCSNDDDAASFSNAPNFQRIKAHSCHTAIVPPCFTAKMELCAPENDNGHLLPRAGHSAAACASTKEASDVSPSLWQWLATTTTGDDPAPGKLHPEGYKLQSISEALPPEAEDREESPDSKGERACGPPLKEMSIDSDASVEGLFSRPLPSRPPSEPQSFNFAMQLVSNWGPAG